MSEDPRILDKLDASAITRHPDYERDKPPRLLNLHRHGSLDEYQKIWGRRSEAMGISRLRTVGLIRPQSAWEDHAFWQQDPTFFLLRYRQKIDPQCITMELDRDDGPRIHG